MEIRRGIAPLLALPLLETTMKTTPPTTHLPTHIRNTTTPGGVEVEVEVPKNGRDQATGGNGVMYRIALDLESTALPRDVDLCIDMEM